MAAPPEENQNCVVAVFGQHSGLEDAVKALKNAGYDTSKLSIIGRDSDGEVNAVGFYHTGGQLKHWGKLSAFWERLWDMRAGEVAVVMPGLYLVIIAGSSLVNKVERALQGSIKVEGLSAVGAAVYALGISKDSAVKYDASVKAGKFVLIAHGTADEVRKAHGILQNSGAESINMHQAPADEIRVA